MNTIKCREFESLRLKIDDVCDKAGFSKGAKQFFIHKISRRIKTFKDDIYDITVSHKPFEVERGYYSYFKIDAQQGSIYVRVTVD